MSVSVIIRVTRSMRMRMALGFNNLLQYSDERRHTYVMVVSPHCKHTKQVDTQADGADQQQLVGVHLWGV